jgi:tRNA 5-methylaminomethyl-2-thiouridine biosynthesis bifunctional protein
MATSLVPAWMRACGLPVAWQGLPRWCVLETDFADGDRFLALWQQWAQDPAAPRTLHVVALARQATERETLRQAFGMYPALAPWAEQTLGHWFGFLPGFHRLALHDGRLQLTLCIGPSQQSLRELQFCADSVLLGHPVDGASAVDNTSTADWDTFGLKALARLCRLGTQLALQGLPTRTASPGPLKQAGFTDPAAVPESDPPRLQRGHAALSTVWGCSYQPHWPLNRSRQHWHRPPVPVSQCIVVGAGLAGAAVADALARRGWQVTVLDSAAHPASGASALPVGLLVPHVSRDDSPRSRLSRAGMRLTLQAAQRLLVAGADYATRGVAELAVDHQRRLPVGWGAQGRHWSDDMLPPDVAAQLRRAGAPQDRATWHAHASWIKPARLVQALLAQPGIRFQGNSPVQQIGFAHGAWQLRGPGGELLAQAPQLVLANAGDAPRLVDGAAMANTQVRRLAALTALRGQVSWARNGPDAGDNFPPFPVNGAGSVIAHVPHEGGLAWFAGATYETAGARASDAEQAHAHNRAQLTRLLPAIGTALIAAFDAGSVQIWQGTRWSTADRLPLVGALFRDTQCGIWASTAMGSRGLSLALLCAEVLAAQMCSEPLPLPARLSRLIAADRAQG